MRRIPFASPTQPQAYMEIQERAEHKKYLYSHSRERKGFKRLKKGTTKNLLLTCKTRPLNKPLEYGPHKHMVFLHRFCLVKTIKPKDNKILVLMERWSLYTSVCFLERDI